MSNSETFKQGYEQGRNDIIEIAEECFEYFKGNDNIQRIKERFEEKIK